MDEPEVQCNQCSWQGDALDLVSKTDDINDKDFNYCPQCGSSEIEDIDIDES